jgi:hypothetical protein
VKTIVYPGRAAGCGAIAEVIGSPISVTTAAAIADDLAADDSIYLAVRLDGNTVHLWPIAPVDTAQEVHALRAFAAVTDSPLAWHPSVTA